jgi:hypothetical protein
MGQVTEIAKPSDSVVEKTKQISNLAVDKTVEKAKRESGSTASAIKSFIAGISPYGRKVDVRWFRRDMCCPCGTSIRFN